MNAHSYAVDIEHILSHTFGFDGRGGLAGLIDADSIEHDWYAPIAATLGYIYATASNEKKDEILRFINDYGFYLDIGLSELFMFESNERVIDGSTCQRRS
jgi:hypothetical protein